MLQVMLIRAHDHIHHEVDFERGTKDLYIRSESASNSIFYIPSITRILIFCTVLFLAITRIDFYCKFSLLSRPSLIAILLQMLTPTILENTVPMTECRSPQLFLVPRTECTTPDSQVTIYEFPFDSQDHHIVNPRPRRPEPPSLEDLPLFSYLPGPDHANRDDYFGDWEDQVRRNNNETEGKGKGVDRETCHMDGLSRQWEDLVTISSPSSSCASLSPCSQMDCLSIYHQQNIPLTGVALSNSEPFCNEGGLHAIPERAIPFNSDQAQNKNTIRIEIPAKFGPRICEQVYQGKFSCPLMA